MDAYNKLEQMEDELIQTADQAETTKHFSREIAFYLNGYHLNKKQKIRILRRAIELVAVGKQHG